ncbi:Uu.00g133770.m01.CDS01 [Anthostomella pinea]|uniref:Uu.00g133770.m01.CDS01 n=1 Tax=Anthostomella pinea TaxID=933095 RepID=A0AAI8VPR8_9PEZI|nr:Uu.00g133770.m01.CDS01 [Anthostomella pinea]
MSPVDVSVALAPADLQAVPKLLEDMTKDLGKLNAEDQEARHEFLLKARTLVQSLETPRETMIKHCWAQAGALAGLQLGVDTGLWKLMAKNGDEPQKVGDLADALGIEKPLLSRMMRHLGAMGYVVEVGEDVYKTNNFSKSLSIPIIGDGYLPMLSGGSCGAMRFPEYARKNNWREPTDAHNTAMHYAYNTKLDFFARQHEIGYGEHFNHHMGGYRQGRLPWMDPSFYPVKERLIEGADSSPDVPFLIDIGGSVGHDVSQFLKMWPDHPGKLVLQDLGVVVNQIKDLDPGIQRMEYDFHAPQPLKGARAYYMHSCLHDWPDSVCLSILGRIKEAMKPGYSKLLINENVIPTEDAWWETTALDMVMLTYFASRERTRTDWENLMEKAGLKIVKIYGGGHGVESLLEIELA